MGTIRRSAEQEVTTCKTERKQWAFLEAEMALMSSKDVQRLEKR